MKDTEVEVFMLAKALYYTTVEPDNYIKFEDSPAKNSYLRKADSMVAWLSKADYWLVYTGMGQ